MTVINKNADVTILVSYTGTFFSYYVWRCVLGLHRFVSATEMCNSHMGGHSFSNKAHEVRHIMLNIYCLIQKLIP